MTIKFEVGKSVRVGDFQNAEASIVSGTYLVEREKDIGPAVSATMKTYVSPTVGVLTYGSGSMPSIGSMLDIYWANGTRQGVIVSAVNGFDVSFSLGGGDNLPSGGTPLSVAVPLAIPLGVINGSQLVAINVYAGGGGLFRFTDPSGVEVGTNFLPLGPMTDSWYSSDGSPNPLYGSTINNVYISHGDLARTFTMRVALVTS